MGCSSSSPKAAAPEKKPSKDAKDLTKKKSSNSVKSSLTDDSVPMTPPPTLSSDSLEGLVEGEVNEQRSPHLPEWVKAVDDKYETAYYFNTVTGESRWTPPDEYEDPEPGTEEAKAVAAYVAARVAVDHADKAKRLAPINSNEELEEELDKEEEAMRKQSMTVAQLAEQFAAGGNEGGEGEEKKRKSSTAGDFEREIKSSGETVADRIRRLSASSNASSAQRKSDLEKEKEAEMAVITRSRGSSNAYKNHYQAIAEIEVEVVNRKDF